MKKQVYFAIMCENCDICRDGSCRTMGETPCFVKLALENPETSIWRKNVVNCSKDRVIELLIRKLIEGQK